MLNEIMLILPYPVSSNRYWRTFMPKGFKVPVTTVSKEAKEYKAEVRVACRIAGITAPISGRIQVDISLYPKRPQDYLKRMKKSPDSWDDDVQCIDLDNARKVLYDSLKGLAFDDDKWVFKDSAQRMEPDGEARVVVKITAIQPNSQQASLLGVAE
jgi:crossover junction endodeoxyribonuclease RusA